MHPLKLVSPNYKQLISARLKAGVLAQLLLSVCFICSTIVHASESEAIRVLTINTSIVPPYSNTNGRGFEDLLAAEVYKRAGYQIDILGIPSERALYNINMGINDGCLSRIGGLEKLYPNMMHMDESVVEWKFVAFTKREDIKITSWVSLKPFKVAYLSGWKIFDINIKQSKSILKVRSPTQLYRLLDSGRVDVVLHALEPGKFEIKKLGFRDIRPHQPPLSTRKKYLYLHKKHADLLKLANTALIEIKKDGTYRSLYKQTIGINSY